MAKQFKEIKQGLGLLDLIPIGKYKNCRVDSILEQDDAYLRYMQQKGILKFTSEVTLKLKEQFSTDYEEEENYDPRDYQELNFQDVPF